MALNSVRLCQWNVHFMRTFIGVEVTILGAGHRGIPRGPPAIDDPNRADIDEAKGVVDHCLPTCNNSIRSGKKR